MKAEGYISEIFTSFQGEGTHVGRRHLFVRLAGCNLRCVYCDTPDSLERTPGYTIWRGHDAIEGNNPVSVDELGAILRDLLSGDEDIDAIALTGGEPLVQADFLAALLSTHRLEKPVLLETNGVLPRRLAEVLPFIDIISMDIKLPSSSGEPAFWTDHAEFLRIGHARELYVKIVVDEDTVVAEVGQAAKLIHEHAPEAAVYLQPKTGATDGVARITAAKLDELYRTCHKLLKSLRVLPQTHKAMGLR